jgi:hypothetical protein
MRVYAAPLLAVFVMLVFMPARATTLPIYQDVLPGQYLAIDFEFTALPPAGADVLMANGGGVANGLLGSDVLLYHDGVLIAQWTNPMLNTFAIFAEPGSPYKAWGTNVDLSQIFNGGNSRMEFHPIFDPSIANATVNYQLDFFGAYQSTSGGALSDAGSTPSVLSVSVVQAVPLPSSFLLFVSAIFAAGAKRRSKGSII